MKNQTVTVLELEELLAGIEGAMKALCDFIGHDGEPGASLVRLRDVRARLAAYGLAGVMFPVEGAIGGAA